MDADFLRRLVAGPGTAFLFWDGLGVRLPEDSAGEAITSARGALFGEVDGITTELTLLG